jgi:hypothetical protein
LATSQALEAILRAKTWRLGAVDIQHRKTGAPRLARTPHGFPTPSTSLLAVTRTGIAVVPTPVALGLGTRNARAAALVGAPTAVRRAGNFF